MAIFKARVDSDFQVLSNKTAQDTRLSFEARGMLVLLLSMPEDWSVNVAWLQKQSSAGRDKVNRILNELIENGYVRKSQVRDEHGQFKSQDYFVYAESAPTNAFSVNGNGGNDEPPTTKETVLQSKDNTKLVPKGTCKNSVEFVPNPEPNVPHQEIINLFRQILPDLPQVKKLTDARRRSIKARHTGMFKKDLANWEKYFTYVKTNCTWMTSGSFSITFDYLIKQANVVAIMEGAKDDRH